MRSLAEFLTTKKNKVSSAPEEHLTYRNISPKLSTNPLCYSNKNGCLRGEQTLLVTIIKTVDTGTQI
jgi:hypothetical protein